MPSDPYDLAELAYIQTAQADPELTGFYETGEHQLRAIGRALHGAGWLTPAEAERLRALLGAADPTPRPGDRVQDGGQWGTLVRCPQCDGDGLLHQLDPDELARMATTRPSSAFEVDSLPVAGPSCGATLGDRCLIKGHPEECEPRTRCSCGRALPCATHPGVQP